MKVEEYDSFLVRFWRNQPEPEQQGRWQGEIEHIQSGIRWHFSTLSDLLAFLQQSAVAPNAPGQPDPGTPLRC